MTTRYTVVFSGRVHPGQDIETVKKNLTAVFGNDPHRVARLFSGKPVVIKKEAIEAEALKFKAVFERCGAVCTLVPVSDAAAAAPAETAPPTGQSPCPACGHEQAEGLECARCGIVFEKHRERNGESPNGAPVRRPRPEPPEAEEDAPRTSRFRKFRIAILFGILVFVAVSTFLADRHILSWKQTVHVVIYPINGDHSQEVSDYLATLGPNTFAPIEDFMAEEARLCDLPLAKPVAVHLAPEIKEMPPELPTVRRAVDAILWSLKMRYWAFRNDPYKGPEDVRIYVIYHTGAEDIDREESVGLRKGKIGLVRAPVGRKMIQHVNLIITHEMLHTFGATDEYDFNTLMPIYPYGYAEPKKKPLYPQRMAEIMAGRIPLSKNRMDRPRDFSDVTIGVKTCVEIHWLDKSYMSRYDGCLPAKGTETASADSP